MEIEQQSRNWSCLLPDMLMEICSRLPLADYLTFRLVCKPWRNASNRSVFNYKSPVVLFYGKKRCFLYSFPRKPEQSLYSSIIELPDLLNATCITSSRGWLLVQQQQGCKLSFINPFWSQPSSSRKELPPLPPPLNDKSITAAVFRSIPTEPDCKVCVMHYVDATKLVVAASSPGENGWAIQQYMCNPPSSQLGRTILYTFYGDGVFGFADSDGWVTKYYMESNTIGQELENKKPDVGAPSPDKKKMPIVVRHFDIQRYVFQNLRVWDSKLAEEGGVNVHLCGSVLWSDVRKPSDAIWYCIPYDRFSCDPNGSFGEENGLFPVVKAVVLEARLSGKLEISTSGEERHVEGNK